MDFVIITFPPDIKLLRHCVASYDLYYQDKDGLYIFASRKDKILLEQIDIPHNAKIIFREDYPELTEMDPSSHAAFLKLMAYQVVTTEYFCVIDSDFLFIAPIQDQDFLPSGKPIWFYREAPKEEPSEDKRRAVEGFIGQKIDYKFMDQPQYVFKRSVAADLTKHISPLNIPRHEFIVYGWFAHKYHREEYEFVRSDQSKFKSIVGLVNQIPPTYLHLDPSCRYDQFKDYKMVVFWSYWDIANQKMIEFFEDSQKVNFGRVIRQAGRKPLLIIVDPNNLAQGKYRYFEGVFTDGWAKEIVTFGLMPPVDWQSAEIQLMVPGNPVDSNWELSCEIKLDGSSTGEIFSLKSGMNKLPIHIPEPGREKVIKVEMHLGEGFFYQDNPDHREFRARLIAIRKLELKA